MIVSISSHKRAAVRFTFDNGNEISLIWGWGSYSQNHDKYEMMGFGTDEPLRDVYLKRGGVFETSDTIDSKNVEIMADGHDKFIEWFSNNYGDGENPAGYIPVSEIPLILAQADSRKYKAKE